MESINVTKKLFLEQTSMLRSLLKGGLEELKNADDILRAFKTEAKRGFKLFDTKGKYIDDITNYVRGAAEYQKAIKRLMTSELKKGNFIFDETGKLINETAKSYSKGVAYSNIIQHLDKPAVKKYLNDLIAGGKKAEALRYVDDVIDGAVTEQKNELKKIAKEVTDNYKTRPTPEAKPEGKVGKPTPEGEPVKPGKPGGKPEPGLLKRVLKSKGGVIIGGALLKVALLGGVGIGLYWLWKHFFSDVIPEDQMETLQPVLDRLNKFIEVRPCILNILDDTDVTLEIDQKGYLIVKMPHTGVPEYDETGGLGFFDYGVVYKMGQPKALGTYNCKGGELKENYFDNLISNVLFEQNEPKYQGDNNPNTGLSDIIIKWQTDENGDTLSTASGIANYKSCSYLPLPHKVGCYSIQISHVQACLPGIEPNGTLDKPTLNALQKMGFDMKDGLTEEIYNAIMKKCGKPLYQPPKAQNNTIKREQQPAMQQMTGKNSNLGGTNATIEGNKLYNNLIANKILAATDTTKNTVRYKDTGANLTPQQLQALDAKLAQMGYKRVNTRQLPAGSKYIWKK